MSLPHAMKTTRMLPSLLGLLVLFVLIAIWRHHVAENLPLSVDEAYYMAWSKSLDWGYWTKPPVIAWAIAAARSVCGETAGCVRITSLIAFPLTSLALLVLCYRMTKSWTSACLTSALFATLPVSSFYGIAATTDAFLLLFWACAMLCLWLAIEGKFWAWPLLGLSFGLGLLSKYSMLVFGLSALLVLAHPKWRHAWKSPGPYLALLVAFLVFYPNLAWNLKYQMPTIQHTAAISQGGIGYGLRWDVLGKFLLEQLLLGNPFLVIAWGIAMVMGFRTLHHRYWFTLSVSLPILLVISVQALLSRAHANWAAPVFLGICLASVGHLWQSYKKIIAFAFAFNMLFAGCLYHYQTLIAKPFELRGTVASDPFWAVRPWPHLVAQISEELSLKHGQSSWKISSDDRAVLAQVQALLNLPPGSALGWLRHPQPENHFELNFPLPAEQPSPVLLITKAPDDQVQQAFPQAVKQREINANTPLESFSYRLWWLEK